MRGGTRSPTASQQQHAPAQRVGNYVVTTQIGKGSFATVHKGYDARRPRSAVAIKVVTRAVLTEKLIANLEGEISIMQSISHLHIVQLYDCIKFPDYIYLVMGFCLWGDLSMYIKSHGTLPSPLFAPTTESDPGYNSTELGASALTNNTPMAAVPDAHAAINAVWDDVRNFPHPVGGGLNHWIVRSFLFQLSSAVEFMWAKHIVHRDIKPQNILLQPAEPTFLATGHPLGIPQIKVADFGFARHLPAASLAETLCGSPLYMAPEILRHEKYGSKADLWSVGAVTYEMATGKPPFRALNYIELLRRIEKNDDRIRFPDERSESSWARENARRQQENLPPCERAPSFPEDLKKIIRALLKRKAVERAGFDDLFHSAVVASGSGPELARALGRSVPRTVSQHLAPPSSAPTPSTSSCTRDTTSSLVVISPEHSTTAPTTPASAPPLVHPPAAVPSPMPPASSSIQPASGSQAKAKAVPIPQRRPSPHAEEFPRSLPAWDTSRSSSSHSRPPLVAPAFARPMVNPGSLPSDDTVSCSAPVGARAAPARKATFGFTPLPTVSTSPRTQGSSPHMVQTSAPRQSNALLSRDSSRDPQSGSSDRSSPLATPKQRTYPNKGDLHRLGEVSPAASDTPLAGTVQYNVSTSPLGPSGQDGSGSFAAPSPAKRTIGKESLLDGEYAMVDTRMARAATEQGSSHASSSFPGTFNPVYANAAANAARAAAAAALGSAPIRQLSQIRAPSLSKLSGVVMGGFPVAATPALLPDRPERASAPAVPSPHHHRTRTTSAAEPQIDRQGSAPMSMQQRAYTTTTQGRIITNDQNGEVAPFPSLPSSGTKSKPLPIPHRPALALSPRQRPASFSRRSSMPFVTDSPAPDNLAPRQQGSWATSFSNDPTAYRTSMHSYEFSLPTGFAHHSPPLNLSGGLSTENTYRTTSSTTGPSGSLSRALSMAAIRLQGAQPSTTPLRNAQAVVRGDRRSQSMSTAARSVYSETLGTLHIPSGTSGTNRTELDPAEQKLLDTLHDLDNKAVVLMELANYRLPHAGSVESDVQASPFPRTHRASVGSGRSSSSLSLASMAFELGTPGTTPSSTPFSSASIQGGFPSLVPIPDAEAVAAECLLLLVRAASLVDRALDETRQFFDLQKASMSSRAHPELIESKFCFPASHPLHCATWS